MKVEIRDKPSFANVKVVLEQGELVLAQADAMASMSATVRIVTRLIGGFFVALLRRIFGGQSMFMNEFHGPGEVVLTQPQPGDVHELTLNGNIIYVQPGSFIACGTGVSIGLGWAGFASLIGGEGLFRLKLSGTGPLWLGAYGGIFERDIQGELVVDTSHLVAYEPTLSLSMGLAGGIFSSFFSGEGLVTRVKGQGKVYLQSRSLSGLAAWINGYL